MTKLSIAERDIIFKAPVKQRVTPALSNEKIYIREQNGLFQRIRRYLNFPLVGLFIALPFLQYKGRQAILFDVGAQRLDLFGVSLYPQDLGIFALIFIMAAYALFYVTKHYGRVWCGFSCPQTVWTLMFNWVERRIEGSFSQSRNLDKQGWSAKKIAIKGTKHLAWGAMSLFTALVFMSYFAPASSLYLEFFTFQATPLIQGWVWFFAICTYINAGFLREKMCQHICPYSRFQSSMFDNSTSLVTYDQVRGEGRGPRKRNKAKPEGLGDCVDCYLCVQVCPVGIDIREGLQYECINCGLCVDACDDTMDKFGYERGLIDFKAQTEQQQDKKQNFAYVLGMAACVFAMVAWAYYRHDFEVSIIRDRQALYRINSQGDVENTFVIKTLNKSQQVQTYQVNVTGLPKLSLHTPQQFTVAPGAHDIRPFSISVADAPLSDKSEISFEIVNLSNSDAINKRSSFYSGEGAW